MSLSFFHEGWIGQQSRMFFQVGPTIMFCNILCKMMWYLLPQNVIEFKIVARYNESLFKVH